MTWEWKQDRIGCGWSCGDYRISTYMEIVGNKIERSGYRLYYRRIPLDDYGTLDTAKDMAGAHWSEWAEVSR